MEIKPIYDFKLSLKNMTMRKIVVGLWNDPVILGSIERFISLSLLYNENSEMHTQTLESIMKNKVLNLGLPKPLLKEMLPVLTPVGIQIRMWKEFHQDYFNDPPEEFGAPILAKLCWSEAGHVDYRKTAEELIRCRVLDVENQYKIACLYCLEDYIPILWYELPLEVQWKFYRDEGTSHFKNIRLEYCWPYIIRNEQYKLVNMLSEKYRMILSFNQYLFMYSVSCGNKAAVGYFFGKFTSIEKEPSFLNMTFRFLLAVQYSGGYKYSVENFSPNIISGTLLYLLSLMNHETQVQLFRGYASKIMACYLDWPSQEVFLTNVNQMFTYLTAHGYDHLLRHMNRQFRRSKNYFPSMFQEFFLNSPANLRKVFVDRECRFGEFFPKFFNIQDTDTIRVIFRSIESEDRIRLVTNRHFLKIFNDLIWRDKWRLLEICIREAVLTKPHSDQLKTSFLDFMKRTDNGLVSRRKQHCIKFLQILDEINTSILRKEGLKV